MTDNRPSKWILVVGARPNFMKVAPIIDAIQEFNRIEGDCIRAFLVHTGQHYDMNMSDAFFQDLGMPGPDVHLGVGSASHGEQTGRVLIAFEKVLVQEKPDVVIVVGDVNSTLACALAAVKLHIPVAHVESGLRSFDRTMPEEINRLLTDAMADFLFTPSPDADENLLKEGISQDKIFMVGDIMVDSLLGNLEKARRLTILERLSLRVNDQSTASDMRSKTSPHESVMPYGLLTLHRPANVDNRRSLERILVGLLQGAEVLPILFPMHPRTLKQIHSFGLEESFVFHDSPDLCREDYFDGGKLIRKIHAVAPLGYLEFLNLMDHARLVLTDSGGIQEETTVLNIPCITLRDTTERPITLSQGTNVLVHDDPEKIIREIQRAVEGKTRKGVCPPYWDGRCAERIVRILASHLIKSS